ncbi:type 1 fimbria chaperone FimC [Serratia aquatilis]|uniref:Type 1 fimbria chaperone FimC n=2 Tax=Serratia aquatilis TaxID=1737515 RepID=A0ABV6EHB3_9GAMM
MNKIFKCTIAIAMSLAMVLPMAAFSAKGPGGISLGATRVIYPSLAKQTSIALNNSDAKNRYLVNSWVENTNGQKEKSFVITPPLFVSEPKSENTLRIIYAGPPLPKDRETVFWLNVKSIPSVDKNSIEGKNVLQLAILSRIKLFVRPENLPIQPEEALKQVRFNLSGGKLNITNPSPYYVSMVNLKVGGKKLANTMIPPMGSAQAVVPAGVSGSISFQTVNDYGALTPVQNGVTQ